MAKEDVPELPDSVPKKRRQIEALLDVHIAIWLASDAITPSERRKLEEEKQRRKNLIKETIVGFVGTQAGMTPEQKAEVERLLILVKPKAVHCVGSLYSGGGQNFVRICKKLHHQREFDMTLDIVAHRDVPGHIQDIVKEATCMIITPKEQGDIVEETVQKAIQYAKDRGVQSYIIKPNGVM